MDPTPFIVAGLGAASTVGSSAISAGAKWGSSTYMRVAKEMANYNQALSEQMYNKYQSPAAMMDQYKEAGLNPYLMYSNTTPGSPTPGEVSTNPKDYEGSSRSAELAQGISNAINQYQQIVSAEQARTNAKAQYDLIYSQVAYNNARTAAQDFKNSKQEEWYNIEKALKSTKVESDQLNLLIDKKYKEEKAIADLNNKLQDLKNKKVKEDKDMAEIGLINEKIIETRKNVDLMDERIKGIRHSIDMQNKKYELSKQQMAAREAWNNRKFAYRQLRDEAIDSQFDKKMTIARQNLGLRIMEANRNYILQVAEASRRASNDFYKNMPEINPAKAVGIIR